MLPSAVLHVALAIVIVGVLAGVIYYLILDSLDIRDDERM